MIKIKRVLKEDQQAAAATTSGSPLSKFTSLPNRDSAIAAMAKDLAGKTGTDRDNMFFALLNTIGFNQEDFAKLSYKKGNLPAKLATAAATPAPAPAATPVK